MFVSLHNRHTLTQRHTQMKALSPRLKIKFKFKVPFGNQECFTMNSSFWCVEAVSLDKLLKQTRSMAKPWQKLRDRIYLNILLYNYCLIS